MAQAVSMPAQESGASQPPSLWDLWKSIVVLECVGNPLAVQEVIRSWGPPHPGLENHPALPVIRVGVRHLFQADLSRESWLRLRDLIIVHRSLSQEMADRLPLTEVAEFLRPLIPTPFGPDSRGEARDPLSAGESPGQTVSGESLQAPDSPAEPPFIATELQERILEALHGKALTLDALAEKLKTDRSALHRDGLKELMQLGRIANVRRVGYYRTDAPPSKYAKELSPKTH
jgi:hypothetical protein